MYWIIEMSFCDLFTREQLETTRKDSGVQLIKAEGMFVGAEVQELDSSTGKALDIE